MQVVTTQAGLFASIDYSKADIWAVGALAYEIFTGKNPFFRYKNQETEVLRNTSYSENMLPKLPDEVPRLIARLIRALLIRNPSKVFNLAYLLFTIPKVRKLRFFTTELI